MAPPPPTSRSQPCLSRDMISFSLSGLWGQACHSREVFETQSPKAGRTLKTLAHRPFPKNRPKAELLQTPPPSPTLSPPWMPPGPATESCCKTRLWYEALTGLLLTHMQPPPRATASLLPDIQMLGSGFLPGWAARFPSRQLPSGWGGRKENTPQGPAGWAQAPPPPSPPPSPSSPTPPPLHSLPIQQGSGASRKQKTSVWRRHSSG